MYEYKEPEMEEHFGNQQVIIVINVEEVASLHRIRINMFYVVLDHHTHNTFTGTTYYITLILVYHSASTCFELSGSSSGTY
jgi:hypothetical protein